MPTSTDRHLIFLVHGACDCGWECAVPEGGSWPTCPVCAQRGMLVQVMPPRANPNGASERERENGRQAYYRTTEQEALREAYKRGYEYRTAVTADVA